MKKAFWLLVLATLLACGPTTANPSANANGAEEAEDETAVTNTEDTEDIAETDADDETAVAEATEAESSPLPAAANFDGFAPASTVEEAAIIREQDWRKGATDPSVVIIEYGDFQ